jgi:hypothetical protein
VTFTTLSDELKAKANANAIEYLEYSIVNLASLLGVDVDDLSETWENPVPEDNSSDIWNAYECLRLQVIAHSRVSAV